LVATVRLEHEALALQDAYESVSGLTVEAERVAAHSTKWTMPCLWVAHDDPEGAGEAIRADPSVDTVVEQESYEGETYYQLEWADEVEDWVDAYVDQEASILQAKATDAGWQVKIRFADRDQFDAFADQLNERDHSFNLLDLFDSGSPPASYGGLMAAQHDALVAALEAGYYEVPRETTMQELAADLGISHQSLSELLRRGTAHLLQDSLSALEAE
jgi:predicted DNA binding protein